MHLLILFLILPFLPSTHSHANPALTLLSPLIQSTTSRSFALQTGLSQFSPLLPSPTLNTLQASLAIIPENQLVSPLTVPVLQAFAAARLGLSNSEQTTLNSAQKCIEGILSQGKIPTGYTCVDSNKNTLISYQTTFNTILEQFVGIVLPSTFTLIQQRITSSLFLSLGLIPPANDLNQHIQNALASVVASNSGETVTAIERLEDCLKAATTGTSLEQNKVCFAGPQSPVASLNTLFAGVVQQFVGYLPPNVVADVINIYSYYLSAVGAVPGLSLMRSLNLSLNSIVASTSGNTATFLLQLTQCFAALTMSPDPSTYNCIAGPSGPIFTLQVAINGIIQQAFGYLPPTLLLQLESDLTPELSQPSPSPSTISQIFRKLFNLSTLGPKFVTCFEALEDCINERVLDETSVCRLEEQCRALAQVDA